MELKSGELNGRLSWPHRDGFAARSVEEISRRDDAIGRQRRPWRRRLLFRRGRYGRRGCLRRERASRTHDADNLERQDRGCREQQNIEHEPPPSHCLSFRWSRDFVARLRWLTGGENISGNRERGQKLFGLTNAHDSHFHVR